MTWRTTKDAKDLDFRCDLCGKPANTLHFIPWVGNAPPEKVLFACPNHDPGGYWTELERWFDPQEQFPAHVAAKEFGFDALALLADRIDALRRL